MTAREQQVRWWAAVGAIALIGLALRVACAHGALWTDEAWSAVYAAQARDPLGVFLRINHDNNHHLNSLWMQAVGLDAAPLLARLPAILAGTLMIPVAALVIGRRSSTGGLVAALLFAVSPILVAFGAEARGYGMMLLAAVATILLVADAVDGRPAKGMPWWLAGLTLFGMFSHLTMIAPIVILTVWAYCEVRTRDGPVAALATTARWMGPAIACCCGAILFVFVASKLSPAGMRLGGYDPFSVPLYLAAVDDLGLWSVGLSTPLTWLMPIAIGMVALRLALRPPAWLGTRARLYAFLILTVPIGLLLMRSGNVEFARYYLASALGLLLLFSDWIGRGLAQRLSVRIASIALVAVFAGASLIRDWQLIELQRGHPDGSVRTIASLDPGGAVLALDQPKFVAAIDLAARQAHYPLHLVGGCHPADFLLRPQARWAPAQPVVTRCGVPMQAVESSMTTPITGDAWVLYRAQSLQTSGPPVSGPAPRRAPMPPPRRAGVAQG